MHARVLGEIVLVRRDFDGDFWTTLDDHNVRAHLGLPQDLPILNNLWSATSALQLRELGAMSVLGRIAGIRPAIGRLDRRGERSWCQ